MVKQVIRAVALWIKRPVAKLGLRTYRNMFRKEPPRQDYLRQTRTYEPRRVKESKLVINAIREIVRVNHD